MPLAHSGVGSIWGHRRMGPVSVDASRTASSPATHKLARTCVRALLADLDDPSDDVTLIVAEHVATAG
jgi:hypothetical protein